MDKIEYEKTVELLKIEHKKKLGSLGKEFAMSNNTVKVDDIIRDHIGVIKVESIGLYMGIDRIPGCIYSGPEYTKKLIPRKDGSHRSVYQQNLISEGK